MSTSQKESAGTPGLSDNSEYGLTIGSAGSRYSALAVDKYIYLQRARQVARVTIPMLFPPQGHSSATNYYTPFQSIGADGLNNLAAKLVLALFPPGEPFFKLVLTNKSLNDIIDVAQNSGEATDIRATLEAGLSKLEEQIVDELEQGGARSPLTEAIKQLIVAGNALIHVLPDNKLKTHRLENYVVRRDVDGNPIEIITRETLRRQSLPEEAQEMLAHIEHRRTQTPQMDLWRNAVGTDMAAADRATTFDGGAIDLFTIAYMNMQDDKWHFHQEMMGYVVPGTDGTWPKDTPAMIPLTWYLIQGEHYGRGHGEEYLGDLNSLEALSQAVVEFAGIASTVKGIVDETGITSIEDLTNSPNGAFLNGEVRDGKPVNVGFLMLEKSQDFTVVEKVIEQLEQRLNRAFMQTDQSVRDAERVTAEEIRMLAKSLEDRLGGAYAMQSQTLQRPLVKRIILNMQKQGKIDYLPKDAIKMEIVAGLEGLGREDELQRLQQGLTILGQYLGPEGVVQNFNVPSLITRVFAALRIDPTGLAKSQQELDAAAQQQQQNEMMHKLGGPLIKAGSDQAISMRENPNSPIDQGGAEGLMSQLTQQTGLAQGGIPGPNVPPAPGAQ